VSALVVLAADVIGMVYDLTKPIGTGRSVVTKGSDGSNEMTRHAQPYQLAAHCIIPHSMIQADLKRTCKQLLG